MIPATLLCVTLSGCSDQQPTAPKVPRIARSADVPFNKFFVAWSRSFSAGPIQTQIFALDPRQNRQYVSWWVDQSVIDFARANPGRLYINGDEPDQYCVAPAEYAATYHDFVAAIRTADPTARVSPAGVAEPNWHCCPLPDNVPAPCWTNSHSIGYMDAFYNAYVQLYGVAPPVDEWRFHDFGLVFDIGDVNGWWARVQTEAAWSVAHGANMVLGAFGFNAWRESESDYQEHLKQAMGLLLTDPRIVEVDYWSYENWVDSRFYLADGSGSLTQSGLTYMNPLTDVPTGVTLTGSANARATLQWNNTTSAWATEAEFWVQSPGSSSFVYAKTERVAGPGATQTPLLVFAAGDSVKGRVRYYNRYGQAAWSPFSNAILLGLGEFQANKSNGSTKGPLLCLLPWCQKAGGG